jgi:hypothetical protein
VASRWDYIQDLKPVPIAEHLIEELAKVLSNDLMQWPLQVEAWSTPADQQRFSHLVEPGSPRPDDKVFEQAFKLARWELENDFLAIDEYMRNQRWREHVTPTDYDALIFLSRYMTEQMIGVAEATHNRIKRPQLIDCLNRIERKLQASQLVLPV